MTTYYVEICGPAKCGKTVFVEALRKLPCYRFLTGEAFNLCDKLDFKIFNLEKGGNKYGDFRFVENHQPGAVINFGEQNRIRILMFDMTLPFEESAEFLERYTDENTYIVGNKYGKYSMDFSAETEKELESYYKNIEEFAKKKGVKHFSMDAENRTNLLRVFEDVLYSN